MNKWEPDCDFLDWALKSCEESGLDINEQNEKGYSRNGITSEMKAGNKKWKELYREMYASKGIEYETVHDINGPACQKALGLFFTVLDDVVEMMAGDICSSDIKSSLDFVKFDLDFFRGKRPITQYNKLETRYKELVLQYAKLQG
jgi:hypothetical protein